MLKRILSIGFLVAILMVSLTQAQDYYQNEILFCLKADRAPLNILHQNGKVTTNNLRLNRLLGQLDVVKIEQWLPMADDRDVVDGVRLANIYRVVFKSSKSMQQLNEILNKFRLLEDVHSAAPEAINRIQGSFESYIPNDPYFDKQWYLKKIGADQAWGLWKNGLPGDSTVLVGVVDTGVDYEHPELANVLYINPGEDINHDGRFTSEDENGVDDDGNGYIDDVRGWDFAGSAQPNEDPDNDVRPPQAGPHLELSHGTHVAGVIAAMTDNSVGIAGISFRSKIIATKHAFDDDLTEPSIIKGYSGVLYCAKLGAKIINCSWGGGYDFYGKLVVDNVTKNYGAIVVGAAGNDGHNNDENPQYPSDFDNAVCVAALRNDDKKAYYSNFGEVVDISAPGGEGSSYTSAILSTVHANAGSYASWQGTSMAAPVVAGALALLKAWFPDDSRDQLLNRMYNAADPIDNINPNYKGLLGHGRVNVFNAIARGILPNIRLTDYQFETKDGTGATPGDSLSLTLALSNGVNWQDAYHVKAVLSSTSSFVYILDSLYWIDELPAGADTIIDQFHVRLWIDSLAPLQDLPLQLKITANDTSEYSFEKTENLTLTISMDQKGFPIQGFGINSPIALTQQDGNKYIVGISGQSDLLVFDQTGKKITGFPIAVDATSAAPVVADLDQDGRKEIVTLNRRGVLRILDFNGTIKKQFDLDEPVYGDLVVGNFDNDPELEMAFGSMRKKFHVFNLDSSEAAGFPKTMSSLVNLGGAVADLNNDGLDDIVIGTFDNKLHFFTSGQDSMEHFSIDLSTRLVANPVIGKVQDSLFILVVTLDQNLISLDRFGNKIFQRTLNESIVGAPMIADVDQNGIPEIAVVTNDGYLHILEPDSTYFNDLFPMALNGTPQSGPISFDVDDDGLLEILTIVDQGLVHLIKINGQEVANFPVDLGQGVGSIPVIDDLDGDGDTEVLIGGQSNIFAIDLHLKAGQVPAWNTYQGNNHRSGSYGLPVTAIKEMPGRPLPESFQIFSNYPNPFNNETVIRFNVPARFNGKKMQLKIFNVLGQMVYHKTIENLKSGMQRIKWSGIDDAGKALSSGIYFYQLKIGNLSQVRRLLLIK
ncbi:MAG: S8 family peptidase [Caldisericaceae bacterium]|nr:S8 family peptidase [Caldisericaceae bacterium]